MEHDNYRITGFGAISQEDARELERQQAELLKDETKNFSYKRKIKSYSKIS